MFYAFTSGLGLLTPPALVRGMGAASYTPAQMQAMIVQQAQAQGVPVNLALGVVDHETGGTYNPNLVNSTLNSNGTWDSGLFQLNDSVLQTYGISRAAALDPQTNIDTGVSLLASLLNKYNGNQQLALWAYAQGAGTVANSSAPNSSAQNFIDFVTSFDATPILSALGMDSGSSLNLADLGSGLTDQLNATVAGIDLTDPSTLLVGLGLVLGIVWLVREV